MTQNTEAENWEPLTVDKAVVVTINMLRWTLSAMPDPDWVTAFQNAPLEKSGTGGYATGPYATRIVGQKIEWSVEEPNHLDANLLVRQKVEAANAAYRGVLAKRAAAHGQLVAAEEASKEAIKKAQQRLDNA